MTVVIIIVAVLVIGYLLYLGNKKRQVEAARKRERLGAQAEGHRSMASSHEQKAAEHAEAAQAELSRAERHEERAAEVDPNVEAEEARRR
jgi:uncharacterized protein HemX